MNPEDLLTLADRDNYYQSGIQPQNWGERLPEQFSPDLNKAHDNIRRLCRENDVLIANQFKLRKALKRALYFCALAILAAWAPLWLPMLKRLAGIP